MAMLARRSAAGARGVRGAAAPCAARSALRAPAAAAPPARRVACRATEKEPLSAEQAQEAAAKEVARWAAPLPGDVEYSAPTGAQQLWTKVKLAFAWPWRRFKSGSVLAFKIDGQARRCFLLLLLLLLL